MADSVLERDRERDGYTSGHDACTQEGPLTSLPELGRAYQGGHLSAETGGERGAIQRRDLGRGRAP